MPLLSYASLKASVRQLVSQSVENSKILWQLFESAFWVDLKACLDLVLPNQYGPIVI